MHEYSPHLNRTRRRLAGRALAALAVVAALLATVAVQQMAHAAASIRFTFVNATGETMRIGGAANTGVMSGLPVIPPGASRNYQLNTDVVTWSGQFYAMEGCDAAGNNCAVNLPAISSRAEFAFDNTQFTPYYNVSYVDGVTTAINIRPDGSPVGDGCPTRGCGANFRDACAAAVGEGNVVRRADGRVASCKQIHKESQTAYSNFVVSKCPLAYSWAYDDKARNVTGGRCLQCSGFTVTFA